MNKLILRWTDKEGKPHSKEYDKEPEARKARDWLLKNGAEDVDIAVIIVLKPQEDASTPYSD